MIAHASIDEHRTAHGGAAGDQTGSEVCCRSWYNGNWNLVLRCKDAQARETMATAAEWLARSNLVGYDQWQRNDAWDAIAALNWNYRKLTKKTETDCSAFMTLCARIAGIEVPRVALGNGKYNAPVTQTMRAAFTTTGKFEPITASKYLTSDLYLLRGDILVRESGHTAINLTTGSAAGADFTTNLATNLATGAAILQPAKYYDKALAGKYCVTASELNFRAGAGTQHKVLATAPRGTICHCSGYYNVQSGKRWLYVWFPQGSATVTAYAIETYLWREG